MRQSDAPTNGLVASHAAIRVPTTPGGGEAAAATKSLLAGTKCLPPSKQKVPCPRCGEPKEPRARTCRACSLQSPEERFWAKVDKNGPVPLARPDLGPCWVWTGGKHEKGYGRFWFDGSVQPAHRVAYELLVGPIPDGLHLDHLCRTPSCVNPGHVEPVTMLENFRRGRHVNREKTHCPQGHVYDDENTYVEGGRRHCRICVRDAGRRYYDRRKRAA